MNQVGRGGDADLRNLGLYMAPCEEGSLIIVVSDGVHDNLDPEVRFLALKEMKGSRGTRPFLTALLRSTWA